MTLQDNEVVYTADLMNIAPSNDAQIYGMTGNWILNGLSVVSSNATSITLSAGRAIIQGRLFELKANTEYAVNSEAGFIGLNIDLTQTNSEDNNVVTNNQFTFGFGASEFGDTLAGDVNAFVGLYAIDGKGGYTQKVFNYYRKQVGLQDWGYGYFQDYSDDRIPTAIREGRHVHIYGALKNKYKKTGKDIEIVRVLPIDMRPPMQVTRLVQISGYTTFGLMLIETSGEIKFGYIRNGSNNYDVPSGGQFNLDCDFIIEY